MGNLNVAAPILQAVDLLVGERISELQFDKTIQARIISCADNALGKYQIKYQDSYLYAYSNEKNKRYTNNTEVYVRIPNGDFSVDSKEILGTVKKLGADYVDAVSYEDRYTQIGTNVLSAEGQVGLCSYRGTQEVVLYQTGTSTHNIDVDATGAKFYAQEMVNFLLGASFQTKLEDEQKLGQGHYGIKVKARYYNNKYNQQSVSGDDSTVERTYILDVDNMTGQPYNYILPSRQTAIFDTDGDNFIEITYISFFCSGFPVTDMTKTEPDLFMSAPEFWFMEKLTEEQLAGTSVKILTPNGGFFASDDVETIDVYAEFKLQGKIIADEEQTVKYYWFVEDMGVNGSNSPYFNSCGGLGWRCLNPSSEISDNTRVWTPYRTKKFTLTRDICSSYEQRIKVVAVYNDQKVAGTKRFYNQGAGFKVEITSSNGTDFYYDIGDTILTATVYRSSPKGWIPYTGAAAYEWGYFDGNQTLYSLDTVGNQHILNDISEITLANIYKCTAYADAQKTKILGTGYVTIHNTYSTEGTYNLVINEGSQVFKYDVNGNSPVSNLSQEEPAPISVLTFDILDANGIELDDNVLATQVDVEWVLPGTKTLLNFTDTSIRPLLVDNNDGTYSYKGRGKNYLTLPFTIDTKYNLDYVNNEIVLHVTYRSDANNPVQLTAHTNFTFTKDGELGTNGTKYICRIVPLNSAYDQVYITDSNRWNVGVTAYPFAVELIEDETVVYKHGGGSTLINRATRGSSSTTWSLMDKRRGATAAFTIDSNGRCSQYPTYGRTNNIIKAEVTYEGNKYIATYSIDSYKGNIRVKGGYRYVQYRSDGTMPQKPNSAPFTVLINGVERPDLSYAWSKSSIFTYSFTDGEDESGNKVANRKNLLPPSQYDGLEVNNWIRVSTGSYEAIIPIQLYLNRYGMAALNAWDGNSIEIDNDNGYILTPQIGAGRKESDNSFTGAIMGKTMESNGSSDVGLMGYGHGSRTFFLDAETGYAYFGVSGKGQIVLVPNGTSTIAEWKINNAELTSPDSKTHLYSGGADDAKRINVNDKFIVYGDGRFSAANSKFAVDADGNITATGGTIANWHIEAQKLYSGNIELNAGGSIKHKNGTWEVKQDGSAIFNNITAKVSGNIAGWEINSWGLKSDAIQIDSRGAIRSTNGWWINNDGSAKFNNITANEVWSLGTDNNKWTQDSFKFNFGTLGTNAVNPLSGLAFNIGSMTMGQTAAAGNVGIQIGQNGASVKIAGDIYANNGYFRGQIIATSGKIGKTNINADGSLSSANGAFTVSADGNMTCTGATINGDITASKFQFGSGENSFSMGHGTSHPSAGGLNVGSGGIVCSGGISCSSIGAASGTMELKGSVSSNNFTVGQTSMFVKTNSSTKTLYDFVKDLIESYIKDPTA